MSGTGTNITIQIVPKTKGGLPGQPTNYQLTVGTNTANAAASVPAAQLPPNVTGLQIVNQGEGNLWLAQNLPLTWNAITKSVIDPNLPAGTYSDPYLLEYVVFIYNSDGVTLRGKPWPVSTNYFTYTYAQNFLDGGTNGATNSVVVNVYAQDSSGNLSEAPAVLAISETGTLPASSTISATPSTPSGLTVTGTKLNIYVRWGVNPDPSVMRYEIDVSTDGGLTWPTTYYTSSEIYSFQGVVGTTYTVRVRTESYTGISSAYTGNVAGMLVGVNGGSDIVDRTITADRLVAGTITANEIATGTITATQIASGTITATQIASGTITATQIATGALTVGTNVGLGTAVDSGGVTSIIGGTVTTDYVNALNITAASVACENLTGTTITGKTVQTASSGQRVVLNTTYTTLSVYDSSNNELIEMNPSGPSLLQLVPVAISQSCIVALTPSGAGSVAVSFGSGNSSVPALDAYHSGGTTSNVMITSNGAINAYAGYQVNGIPGISGTKTSLSSVTITNGIITAWT